MRIGNGAYNQLQLDIYGELMDSVYLYNKYGEPIPHDLWVNLVRLVDYVTEHWQLPDEGIWEVRGGRQEFLYSRLMCWVAVDRGIRLADRRSLPYPFEQWRATRDAIYHDIMQNFWDPKRGTFVQHKGTTTVDASNLLMPMVRFISPTDPRWLGTLRAMTEDLVEDSLVYRYRQDGDRARSTASPATRARSRCARSGTRRSWRAPVTCSGPASCSRRCSATRTTSACTPRSSGPHGEHLGNFPQAFTHLGLISAAYGIDRKLNDRGWIG